MRYERDEDKSHTHILTEVRVSGVNHIKTQCTSASSATRAASLATLASPKQPGYWTRNVQSSVIHPCISPQAR